MYVYGHDLDINPSLDFKEFFNFDFSLIPKDKLILFTINFFLSTIILLILFSKIQDIKSVNKKNKIKFKTKSTLSFEDLNLLLSFNYLNLLVECSTMLVPTFKNYIIMYIMTFVTSIFLLSFITKIPNPNKDKDKDKDNKFNET